MILSLNSSTYTGFRCTEKSSKEVTFVMIKSIWRFNVIFTYSDFIFTNIDLYVLQNDF
jgi:hypothetical protein